MFMNKPAGEGTYLSWHQDRWIDLDQDPQITIYTALDPATQENGCVQLIPGSHRNPFNSSSGAGLLSREQVDNILQQTDPLPLELALGEVVLLHNWTLHSSGTNQTQTSRRAFSVCYMHGETKIRSAKGVDYISVKDGSFPRVFGPGALTVECLGDYRTPIIEV
jgi:ectoine hydroxylase-related dioxygenase (phytanoyl-CoA dioxygenase family)